MIGAEGQLTDERRAGPTNRSGAKSERAGQGSSTYERLVSTSTGNFWAKPHARRPCPGAYVRTGLAPELPDTLEPLTSIRYPQPGIYGRTLVGSPMTPALTGPSRTPQGTSTTPLLANRSQRVRPRPANLQSKAPRRKGPNKCGREDSSGLACQRTGCCGCHCIFALEGVWARRSKEGPQDESSACTYAAGPENPYEHTYAFVLRASRPPYVPLRCRKQGPPRRH